ncbi:MAG: hypothetical protein KKH98_12430, partial [Spirochaetes bacterium]|nr:hypothetical protein [Spirochaetota bacterium]
MVILFIFLLCSTLCAQETNIHKPDEITYPETAGNETPGEEMVNASSIEAQKGSKVTIKTGEVHIEYTGYQSSGNHYTEKNELTKNTTLMYGSINNLNITYSFMENKALLDMLVNVDFSNPDSVNFGYSRLLLSSGEYAITMGVLDLDLCYDVNTTNSYGFQVELPVLPERKLKTKIWAAKVKEGYDSPYYPTYLYGGNIFSEIKGLKFSGYYNYLFEQKEAVKVNDILLNNFSPSGDNVNKITSKNYRGTIRKNVTIDMDANPVFEISIIGSGDENLGWLLEIDDGVTRIIVQDTTKLTGILKYDLKSFAGWSGVKNVTIYLTVFNSPYDVNDNSLYIDYLKIYNPGSGEVLYSAEYFTDWIVPYDITISVLNKNEIISSLPVFYLPSESKLYGFSIKKGRGDLRGVIDIALNESSQYAGEKKTGYAVTEKLTYTKKNLITRLNYKRVSEDFDIGLLNTAPDPDRNLKDDMFFSSGGTSFFGDWISDRVELVSMIDGVKLSGDGGEIYRDFTVDLDKYPYLTIKIGGSTGTDFEYAISVEDESSSYRLTYDSKTGIFSYNVKEITGWQGKKTFKIRIKKGKADLYLYWIKFWRTEISRNYEYGSDRQFLDYDLTYNFSQRLKTTVGIKIWNSELNNHNLFGKVAYNIIDRKKLLTQLYTGLSINKGDELKEIWTFPAFFKYYSIYPGIILKYRSGDFEISE